MVESETSLIARVTSTFFMTNFTTCLIFLVDSLVFTSSSLSAVCFFGSFTHFSSSATVGANFRLATFFKTSSDKERRSIRCDTYSSLFPICLASSVLLLYPYIFDVIPKCFALPPSRRVSLVEHFLQARPRTLPSQKVPLSCKESLKCVGSYMLRASDFRQRLQSSSLLGRTTMG